MSEFSPELLEQLAAVFADELAPRIAAQLTAPESQVEVEPWHLLDVEEAASRLGRSTRWVRERVKAGELTHVRLDGGGLAFELDDLRAFARERRIACTPLARDEEPLHLGEFSPRRLRDVQKVQGRA